VGLFGKKQPETVQIGGKPFRCMVCQNEDFWRRRAQLNTALATFFNFDWANREATCVVCTNCRYIHWFLPEKR